MTDDFAPDGQLAKAIPCFKPREPQRQMAVAVTRAIEKASRWWWKQEPVRAKPTLTAPALRAKESHYLDRLKSVAGSALQPRFANSLKGIEIYGQRGAAERALKLPLPRTSRTAGAGGGDLPVQILSDVILLRSGLIKQSMVISAPASAWRKIHRRGRWSPAPTTTVLAATARCIKIALWSKHVKSDGRRCGGGKPSSLSGGYGG